MLNGINNILPNTTRANNQFLKRTATDAGITEQSQKPKYFHSEGNVRGNEQENHLLTAVTNVLTLVDSPSELYNLITSSKEEIRPYLWLLVYQIKTGSILPDNYNSFNQILNSYVSENTTTTSSSSIRNTSERKLISELEFDSCKFSFFSSVIKSTAHSNDILLRLINSQDIILDHCGKLLSVCAFLRSKPHATFEEFNANLVRNQLVVIEVNAGEVNFEINKEGFYSLTRIQQAQKGVVTGLIDTNQLLNLQRIIMNESIDQNQLIVEISKDDKSPYSIYSKHTRVEYNELPIGLSDKSKLSPNLLQAMLNNSVITSEQFDCYKQIFNRIKTDLGVFYTYKQSIKHNINPGVSIREVYLRTCFNDDSAISDFLVNHLYKDNNDSPGLKYTRYAMLCSIEKYTPEVKTFEKLFKLAFSNKSIPDKDKYEIETILMKCNLKFGILRDLIFASCLKKPDDSSPKSKNPYASVLQKNNEVRLKIQSNLVLRLDLIEKPYNQLSHHILEIIYKSVIIVNKESLLDGAMLVREACINLFMRFFKEQPFQIKKALFYSVFNEATTSNSSFSNSVISEVGRLPENKVRELFLGYRTCPGLIQEMKVNPNLPRLIVKLFNCSKDIPGNMAFTPGIEPEYDETLYYLLEDKIIKVSDIALTPQMFLLISSSSKSNSLELLTNEVIHYFSENHAAEFKEVLINNIDKLVKLDHNARFKKEIISKLPEKLKNHEHTLQELMPSPNGYLVRYIKTTLNSGEFNKILEKISNEMPRLGDPAKQALCKQFLLFAKAACSVKINDSIIDSYFQENGLANLNENTKLFLKAFFHKAWSEIIEKEIIIPKLKNIITANLPSVLDAFGLGIETYARNVLELYEPTFVQEVYQKSFQETCKKIISLDKSINENNPELYVQYVLNTICFRTAINLRTILTNIRGLGVRSKELEILAKIDIYLYDILGYDNDDLCSIILVTPPSNEEIYFIEQEEEPQVFNLGGELMINHNLKNSTIVTRMFGHNDNMPFLSELGAMPENMFELKLNNDGRIIKTPKVITTEIFRGVSTYQHISNYLLKSLSIRSNRSVIGMMLAEDFIGIIASLGVCLENSDIKLLKNMLNTMTFNLGLSLNIHTDVKDEMFRKCNEKKFAQNYAGLSARYFDDYVNIHNIPYIISSIKAHRIENIQSTIEHIRDKLLPEITSLIPYLKQSKLIENINTECKIDRVHHIYFSISLIYIYMSSTNGLGKHQGDNNFSFSIFRMLGVYYLAATLLNLAEQNGITTFATEKKDLASAIIFEIMDALDDSCSGLIANRLFTDTGNNLELKKLQTLTKNMLKARLIRATDR